MMNTGISLYFGNGLELNAKVIEKAREAHSNYAFTSLHIPEEEGVDYYEETKELLRLSKAAGLNLFADVGPETLEKLHCESIEALEDVGINFIRPDYGFTGEEIVELSKKFHIVFNASTISEEDLVTWEKAGADFTRFAACHNFYPKPLTGLSLERVAKINQRLKSKGFQTMAFVSGNETLRGPLFEGLPTVEEHRNEDVFFNMLQLFKETDSDVVLIGDGDVTADVWTRIKEFNEGFITLGAEVKEGYEFIRETVHHDRSDSSDYVIRSQESRNYKEAFRPESMKERKAGSISIGNAGYLRYNGELEIAKHDLPGEERVNIIGQILPEDMKYLSFVEKGMGFKFL